jgi:hypothetical protein
MRHSKHHPIHVQEAPSVGAAESTELAKLEVDKNRDLKSGAEFP